MSKTTSKIALKSLKKGLFGIELVAKHNPLYGGVYLFDVIAFVEGKNKLSLNLGSARLHFDGAGD